MKKEGIMMTLTLKQLKMTPKRTELLEKMNLTDSDAILMHVPARYQIREIVPYDQWKVKDEVILEGIIVRSARSMRIRGGKTMTKFQLENEDDCFDITIFNRPWASNLQAGQRITVIGYYQGSARITASSYTAQPISELLGITPVYPLKEGMTQKMMHEIIKKTFIASQTHIVETVPQSLMQQYRLLSKKTAYRYLHFPQSMEEVRQAVRTLKYEEFLRFHVVLEMIHRQQTETVSKKAKHFDAEQVYALANQLSFSMTADQFKAVRDILSDMASEQIMYRLIQGDVGCGKTLVASLALYACVLSGHQGAIMAPTEILARQHGESLKKLFRDLPVRIEVLCSSLPSVKKKEVLEKMKKGEVDLIAGTHALFQKDVEFHDLGLVVADEQHRFGVQQRKALKEKGDKVDFLLMSATPIPRTLAATCYGDMDISTIMTMPPGRKPIITQIVKENSLRSILPDLYEQLDQGGQIYIVCSAIEENENFAAKNVTEIYQNLSTVFKGKANVGLMHGKMNSDEKEKAMKDFEDNRTQILVSTTVIEVGVNVVNACCMVIYDAHRFGLSQLHQLRGRVGRGKRQGYCYLLSGSQDPESLARLQIMEQTNDGFEIAMKDLQQRGPGELLGTKQSGVPGLVIGNLMEDTRIIQTARKDAMMILDDPDNPEYHILLQEIAKENKTAISYMD